jgi:hypothetical protein
MLPARYFCSKGCGRHWVRASAARAHAKDCDGTRSIVDDDGRILCRKNCGKYLSSKVLKAHEKQCTGIIRDEDEYGNQLCTKGCGKGFPTLVEVKNHEGKCDGIKRALNEEGLALCINGCGDYYKKNNLLQHESICDGIQRERGPNGNPLCRKCGTESSEGGKKWIQMHESTCDGTQRTRDKNGMSLCRYGCGCLAHSHLLSNHEAQCKVHHASLNSDPRLEYATYLDFCALNGLKLSGDPGQIPPHLANLIQGINEYSKYDEKASEIGIINDGTQMEQDLDDDDDYDDLGEPIKPTAKGIKAKRLTVLEQNQNKLEKAGIDVAEFATSRAELCRGAYWRHGTIQSPDNAILALNNTHLLVGVKRLELRDRCASCSRAQCAILKWCWRSKNNDEGIKLCANNELCQNVCWGTTTSCKDHLEKRKEKNGARSLLGTSICLRTL